MKDKKKGLFDEVARSDDGVDPRDLARRRRSEERAERPGQSHGFHKQEQFLSQVRSALESALQTAGNPILNRLFVDDVVPQGGSLSVVVMLPEGPDAPTLEETTRELNQAAPMLRREVAAAITRKETPNLSFVVLPPGAQRIPE